MVDVYADRLLREQEMSKSLIGADLRQITDPGPFNGRNQSTRRMQAAVKVVVDGFDVTTRLQEYLIKVHITDDGTGKCEIELDDRDGRVPIPPLSSSVLVYLGWHTENLVRVFDGRTQQIEHSFSRDRGRRMTITALGVDYLATQAKTPMTNHLGEGAPPDQEKGTEHSFADLMKHIAGPAGLNVKIHPAFEKIKNDYWDQSHESFMHRMGRGLQEMGGIYSATAGNEISITLPGQDVNGQPTGSIDARWGDNLLTWRVQPVAAKSAWASSASSFYDGLEAQWKTISKGFNFSDNPWAAAQAMFSLPRAASNEGMAENTNNGSASIASLDAGSGTIVINGEPIARMNMHVNLIGARPGVDGSYIISSAEHVYSREGYITMLNVWPLINSVAQGQVGPNQTITTPEAEAWKNSIPKADPATAPKGPQT